MLNILTGWTLAALVALAYWPIRTIARLAGFPDRPQPGCPYLERTSKE